MKRYGVRQFVRQSVCLSQREPTAANPFWFAVRPAGRRYQSIAASAAGECGQCHVVSVRIGN